MEENKKEQTPLYPTHLELIERTRRILTSATVNPSMSEDHQSEKTAKGDSTIELTFLRRSPKA